MQSSEQKGKNEGKTLSTLSCINKSSLSMCFVRRSICMSGVLFSFVLLLLVSCVIFSASPVSGLVESPIFGSAEPHNCEQEEPWDVATFPDIFVFLVVTDLIFRPLQEFCRPVSSLLLYLFCCFKYLPSLC